MLVPETRMIALFEEAGFGEIRRVYQGLFYGGWCMARGMGVGGAEL